MDCNKRFDEINKKISEYFSSVIKFAKITYLIKNAQFIHPIHHPQLDDILIGSIIRINI